ncbi:MAG: DUF1015 domain-containing protein [Deltaproteobacteria bacterium]|nr:DUF1015 domain-containing protein [Deltaproteobacteria bacterium]
MAYLKAFQALRYNPETITDLSRVVTPPYDVISPEEQEEFHKAHPQNIIRLILGLQFETDNEDNNRYTRAAEYFREWRKSRVLVQDRESALYLYTIEYKLENGEPRQRTGFITLVKLEDLDGGSVRRHEKTFSETKSERFRLMKACRANFSPIFALYSDPESLVSGTLKEAKPQAPVVDFVDRDSTRHLLWPVTNPFVIQTVQEWFKGRELFIADGHHRYETAVNYWEYLKKTEGAQANDHPAQYVMMYLCNTSEDLTILPTHRLLVVWPSPLDRDGFLKRAEQYFDVDAFDFASADKDKARARFLSAIEGAGRSTHSYGFDQAGRSTHSYGFAWRRDPRYLLLRMKPGIMNGAFGKGLSDALKNLDTVAFTEVIFRGILGMSDGDLDNHRNLQYSSRYNAALDQVEDGFYTAGFIMNPTRIQQVLDVAKAGLVMPRKSTYFYPKVISGMAINAL